MKKNLNALRFAAIMVMVGLAVTFSSCSKDDDGDSDDSDTETNGDVTLFKKYGIEKGMFIIKSWSTLLPELIEYDTIYFKEYGAYEANYSYNDGDIKLSLVNGDGFYYSIDLDEKTGIKTASTIANGTESSVEYDDIKTDSKTTKLADTTILGKTCTYFDFKVNETMSSRTATYKGIQLYYVASTSNTLGFGFSVYRDCIKLEENVDVPAYKFKVPAGITLTTYKK